MIFTRERPAAARDTGELTGDPWAVGIINDAPDAAAVAADLQQYDDWVDATAVGMGVAPGSEAWETVRQTIRSQNPIGGNPDLMQHGHELPMSQRDFLEYSGDSVREVVGQQTQFQDALLAEYRDIYGNEAATDPRLSGAVDAVMADLKRNGQSPARYAREHTTDFLRDVDMARQLGHSGPSSHDDAGRTGGIGTGGAASAKKQEPHGDMLDDLRSMQKRSGFFG
jgi:hypothetical protein